ncbi:MAG: thiamine phosphate synthase [Alphaproteobacteria bacterium]
MSHTLTAAAWRLNRGRGQRRRGLPALWLLTDEDRLPDPVPVLAALGRAQGGLILRYRDPAAHAGDVARIRRHARIVSVPVLLSGPLRLARRYGLAGAHYAQARAVATPGRPRRGLWLTCAAHDGRALAHAARIGADAAVVAPIFATASHPGARTMGALRLARLVQATKVPIIALGGIDSASIGRLPPGLSGIAAIGALERELSRRSGR